MPAGLCATVNSDERAYFGGYIGENFQQSQQALDLGADDIHLLARNSFSVSFLSDADKKGHIDELDRAMALSTA